MSGTILALILVAAGVYGWARVLRQHRKQHDSKTCRICAQSRHPSRSSRPALERHLAGGAK